MYYDVCRIISKGFGLLNEVPTPAFACRDILFQDNRCSGGEQNYEISDAARRVSNINILSLMRKEDKDKKNVSMEYSRR
jgi:benzoyl-CoA reductase/2-hydroxyglutaryl-CoA dehydratase subunit BcrC/BadD/HgdB